MVICKTPNFCVAMETVLSLLCLIAFNCLPWGLPPVHVKVLPLAALALLSFCLIICRRVWHWTFDFPFPCTFPFVNSHLFREYNNGGAVCHPFSMKILNKLTMMSSISIQMTRYDVNSSATVLLFGAKRKTIHFFHFLKKEDSPKFVSGQVSGPRGRRVPMRTG